MRRIKVPYIIFKTKSGIYGIDAYTSLRVEKVERAATLIRRFDKMPSMIKMEETELALISKDNVGDFLIRLKDYTKNKAASKLNQRFKKMRRWNLFRFLGIPTGHSRHISEEERLAKENREALLALSILNVVLKGDVEPLGYSFIELEIRDDGVYIDGKKDGVYTELLKVDMRAAIALLELAR
ncbi:hypothetical protein [Pyrococcus abyssi]|uniref:Uncharacterized protein n=1 Tax=Pyrococcus abyssi (strain GE5 / Orsay) TaxID=272844 RepID=Q9UZP7_PYRAB|nr:hypothetical protein [Pyrococcus abyssi]CAB50009.1 Hypothetical protein PAB0726 [Pyrococcus abyssi GE5]CCE70511.1 TPA: hypothetical protein PAB0726 [Pyrococcus abyssi GE5]